MWGSRGVRVVDRVVMRQERERRLWSLEVEEDGIQRWSVCKVQSAQKKRGKEFMRRMGRLSHGDFIGDSGDGDEGSRC